MEFLRKFLADDSGAAAVEYALLAACISMALIDGARAAGESVNNVFLRAANEIEAAR